MQTKLTPRARAARLVALVLPVVAAASAHADVTVPDATAQLTAVQTSLGGYSTVMFAIALIATGIMVGVKWIKRGKSAA